METQAKKTAQICVVDDEKPFNDILCKTLREEGYSVISFPSATLFLQWAAVTSVGYDLIVTDVTMPGLSGYDLCRTIRASSQGERIPIVMLTANDPVVEKTIGLNAGADDFIQKPFQRKELLAKIKSLLNIRATSIERMDRIARFISPNLAEMVASDSKKLNLQPHRSFVTVMFIDLRGFTAFSEAVEPEEVLDVLNKYYHSVGHASIKYQATLGHLAGDGIMLFLNDPTPIEHHQEVALRLALEVRSALEPQKKVWQERSYEIDFGIGIAEGHATIGGIGFDRFSQYSVIGPVANFAARLCQAAKDGQILVSNRYLQRMNSPNFVAQPLGEINMKGFQKAVTTNNIVRMTNENSIKKTA